MGEGRGGCCEGAVAANGDVKMMAFFVDNFVGLFSVSLGVNMSHAVPQIPICSKGPVGSASRRIGIACTWGWGAVLWNFNIVKQAAGYFGVR